MPKLKVKANVHEIISRAVEEGIAYGWQRAHKHTDEPGEEFVKSEIETAVMSAIGEVVRMD